VSIALRSVEQRYRWLYKPLIFMLCLIPALGCLGGILAMSGFAQLPGFDLGADPVRFVLDTLGKTALNLLLITLTITPLRRLSGHTDLLRLRRMLGLYACTYALLHFSVYVGVFQSLDGTAIAEDIFKRPFITAGALALLLMLPLALTSTAGMMRRLGRRWQSLHRLIYLIAPLATLHYWKMLKEDHRVPLLYAFMLALLLGWRWLNRRTNVP
jgi:methionine sulfoxide reductase heme-binding subunit